MSRAMVVGTAGHIDHGKSALVRALTGTDPDRLKEEKERGITIDLGFAHAQIGAADLAFVDVPGHERFVRNMLAGVGGIDAVLLVVAADESVMPQTREHFAICRLLGIPAGVIALTKADLADRDMIEVARLDVAELVANSMLRDAPVVPVSARTGLGLDDLRAALTQVAARAPERATDGRAPRLPIDRVFTVRGFGTVVTGTLVAGTLAADDELVVLPAERPVKVRGLQVHGASCARAAAGRRVAVNLGGIEVADVSRGDTLASPGSLEVTRRLDVRLELLPEAPPLKHGARVRFHQGTLEVLGRVALADGHFARLRLESPAVLTRGDRFILRAYSPAVTIGGGIVLDPLPARGPIRTAAGAARLRQLAGSAEDAVRVFVAERSLSGCTVAGLVRRGGMSSAEAVAVVERLRTAGEVAVIADRVVPAAAVRALEGRLLELVAAHHAAEPLSEGLPREEARERLFARAAAGVFEHAVESLVVAGKLVARDRLSLPGRGVSLSADEARARDLLERSYRDAGVAPPDVASAAAGAGLQPALADRMVKLLARQKVLVRLDTLYFHAQALERLKQEVSALKSAGGTPRIDVASFKDRYGISRKYAIPLLEWLDRERVTRRVGDARVVL